MRTLTLLSASPSAAFAEPLTAAEVEHFLGLTSLSPADSERDALIDGLIAGAREMAEVFQGRDLAQKQWELRLDSFEVTEIELRQPLINVELVQYTDSDGAATDLTESTDYIVDLYKATIRPPYGETWPSFTEWPTSAVLARFTSGYDPADAFWSDAGRRIKIGMKLLIADWYHNRLPRSLSEEEVPAAIRALLSAGALPRAH